MPKGQTTTETKYQVQWEYCGGWENVCTPSLALNGNGALRIAAVLAVRHPELKLRILKIEIKRTVLHA